MGEADHTEPNEEDGIVGLAAVAGGRAAAPGVEEPGAAAQQFVVNHFQCFVQCFGQFTDHTETDVVEGEVGPEGVAVGRAAVPGEVEPGAAAQQPLKINHL